MNINTPLLSAEEMEALRADLAQLKSRIAEPVDLASGDHALRKVVPIIERRLELLTGAVDLAVALEVANPALADMASLDAVEIEMVRSRLCRIARGEQGPASPLDAAPLAEPGPDGPRCAAGGSRQPR